MMGIDKEILMNGSGYVDPTAYTAISNTLTTGLTFSDELKYIMKIEHLTVQDISDKSGVSISSIDKYVKGERIPTFEAAQKILSSLGYTMEVFKDNAINYIEGDMDEDERFHKLLNVLFDICKLSGFHIEERVVIKDMRTGRIWR